MNCRKDLDESGLNSKRKSVVEDAAELLRNALKQPPKDIIKCEQGNDSHDERQDGKAGTIDLRPSGLINLGNTCFFNSALQALAAVLLSLVPSTEAEAEIPSMGHIGTSLIGTLRCIPSSVVPGQSEKSPAKSKRTSPRYGNIVDPSAFLGSISKRYKEFKRLRQQDSHDFLRLLFNALDDEHKSIHGKEKERIKALHQEFFSGKQHSKVVCKACKNVTKVEEAFMDLSLAIPSLDDEVDGLIKQMRSLSTEDLAQNDDLSLTDLLHFWSRPVQLANENAFACENCAKIESEKSEGTGNNYIYRPATLQFALKEVPPCLIIHLQRFSVTGVGKRGVRLSKNHTHIAIPTELDLSKFGGTGIYRLTAMVIHEGSSVDSGHYVAVVRYGEDDWWHASDTSVRRLQGTLSNYNPYLLFYTRT